MAIVEGIIGFVPPNFISYAGRRGSQAEEENSVIAMKGTTRQRRSVICNRRSSSGTPSRGRARVEAVATWSNGRYSGGRRGEMWRTCDQCIDYSSNNTIHAHLATSQTEPPSFQEPG